MAGPSVMRNHLCYYPFQSSVTTTDSPANNRTADEGNVRFLLTL